MKRYIIDAITFATDWWGETHGARLLIRADEERYRDIKNDPLQDYISFGFASVDYFEGDVYLEEIEEDEDTIVIKKHKKPIDHIEAGEIKDVPDEFVKDVIMSEPIPV